MQQILGGLLHRHGLCADGHQGAATGGDGLVDGKDIGGEIREIYILLIRCTNRSECRIYYMVKMMKMSTCD